MHRYKHKGHASNWVPRKPRAIPPDLGPMLSTTTLHELSPKVQTGEAAITDPRYIASYNLLNGKQQTILVPGLPPMWTPLPAATKLTPDDPTKTYYRDHHAARFARPFEPAVAAIHHLNPEFDASGVDVFACGSTLGDLVRFSIAEPQPFSFTAHVVGRTVFLLRRNLSPTEVIDNIVGYGNAFPEAYTTWESDVKHSQSHQRVIQYSFGGLEILLRYEADGYIMDSVDDSSDNEGGATVSSPPTADSLADMFSDNAIGKSQQPLAPSTPDNTVTVQHKGRRIPHASLFDMKTRSARYQPSEVLAEQIPRLWLRQIENFILAFHTHGTFQAPDVTEIRAEIDAWEAKSQTALARLANLIVKIRETAIDISPDVLEVRGDDTATLSFHRVGAADAKTFGPLSDVLQARWAGAST